MIECYPPIPVYIVTGIILAMFTTVTSKVESGNRYKADARFALFLIVMLTIPLRYFASRPCHHMVWFLSPLPGELLQSVGYLSSCDNHFPTDSGRHNLVLDM